MEEHQLIESAQKGDLSSFRLLMEQHSRMLWRVMKVLVTDPVLAEDNIQESWVEIWKRLPAYSGEVAFRSWLLTVIAPCSQQRLRHQTLAFLNNGQLPPPPQKPEKLGQAVFPETHIGLELILRRLPSQQRRLFMLHYYAGLDPSEIALVLDLPLKNVTTQWQGAMQNLKARFAEDQALSLLVHPHVEKRNE